MTIWLMNLMNCSKHTNPAGLIDIRRGAIYRAQIAALVLIGRDKSRPYVILTPYVIDPPISAAIVGWISREAAQSNNCMFRCAASQIMRSGGVVVTYGVLHRRFKMSATASRREVTSPGFRFAPSRLRGLPVQSCTFSGRIFSSSNISIRLSTTRMSVRILLIVSIS